MATAALAGPLSIATLGLGAASSIMKGEGQQSADDFRAAQSERAATYGKLKAQQTDAQMLENENTQMGNIDAIRAAAGADPTSPTSIAIQQRAQFVGDRQRSITVDNILAQSQQDSADAAYLRDAGDFALKSSYLDAAMGVGKGLAKGF
jgi:hypothetical protein